MKGILCGVAWALVVAPVAAARVNTHDVAKIAFDTPDDWKAERSADSLAVASPDALVSATFLALDAAGFEEGLKAFYSSIDTSFKDRKMSGRHKVTIHGMKAFTSDGAAIVDGVKMSLRLIVADSAKGKKAVVFVIAAQVEPAKKHKQALMALYESIRPASKVAWQPTADEAHYMGSWAGTKELSPGGKKNTSRFSLVLKAGRVGEIDDEGAGRKEVFRWRLDMRQVNLYFSMLVGKPDACIVDVTVDLRKGRLSGEYIDDTTACTDGAIAEGSGAKPADLNLARTK